MSGRQSLGAQVSCVLGLSSGLLVPHCDQERLFHLRFRLKRASAFPVFRVIAQALPSDPSLRFLVLHRA